MTAGLCSRRSCFLPDFWVAVNCCSWNAAPLFSLLLGDGARTLRAHFVVWGRRALSIFPHGARLLRRRGPVGWARRPLPSCTPSSDPLTSRKGLLLCCTSWPTTTLPCWVALSGPRRTQLHALCRPVPVRQCPFRLARSLSMRIRRTTMTSAGREPRGPRQLTIVLLAPLFRAPHRCSLLRPYLP